MRALCFGDVHLGAGADLGREPGERLAEQSAVLDRIVAIANELAVDVTIFAGDAWERRRPVVAELDAFQAPLSKLDGPLLVVPGNHDVSHVGGITGYDVALFGRPGTAIAHEPAVFEFAGVDVATLPWTPRSVFVAGEGGGDVDEIHRQVAEKVVEVARGLRAQCGDRAILVAHWSVGGAQTDTGMPADLFREPVLPIHELEAIGWDAIVLGHIHKPQVVNADKLGGMGRPIFYVGSPMPLNFGEATGEERGAVMLDVGEKVTVSRIPIASRKLVTLNYPADHVGSAITDAIVKVKIQATADYARRLDVPALRRDLEAAGAHKVWAIQVDVEREDVVRGVKVDETVDDLDAMELWLNVVGKEANPVGSPERRDQILEAHSDYLQEANR